MSSVVAMELTIGAQTRRAERSLDALLRAHEAGGRLIAPTPSDFRAAGSILRKLVRSGVEVRRASIVHDVLIAVTARSIGATVITGDSDFDRIRELHEFSLEIVTG